MTTPPLTPTVLVMKHENCSFVSLTLSSLRGNGNSIMGIFILMFKETIAFPLAKSAASPAVEEEVK